MHRKICAALAIGLSITAMPVASLAAEAVDPAAYPELAPDALLTPILAELRHTLPDVYSVREMRICPARRVKLKDGQPYDWGVQIEFNTKNEAGGYTGIKQYSVVFRARRIVYGITPNGGGSRTGLNGVFQQMIDKQMAACRSVSDKAVQTALASAP